MVFRSRSEAPTGTTVGGGRLPEFQKLFYMRRKKERKQFLKLVFCGENLFAVFLIEINRSFFLFAGKARESQHPEYVSF